MKNMTTEAYKPKHARNVEEDEVATESSGRHVRVVQGRHVKLEDFSRDAQQK